MNLIEMNCYKYWEHTWKNYNPCRQTKSFYPTPSTGKYKQTSQLSRSSLSTLIQIITGQNNLNYVSSVIIPGHTDLCRFCVEEQETFIHLLNECPAFYQRRLALLNGAPVIGTLPWKPRTLLKCPQTKVKQVSK